MERGVGKELARSAAGAAAAHHLASAMRRHVALGHGVVVGSLRVCECCNRELVALQSARIVSLARFLSEERRSELMRSFKVQSPLYRDHADCPLADPELSVKWALWTPDKTGYLIPGAPGE